MESSSSQGEPFDPGHKVNHDVNSEQGPYHDAIIVLLNLDVANLNTKNKEIVQIAASCNGIDFQVYIMPDSQLIDQRTSYIHGIIIRRNENMIHHNVVVDSFSPTEGLTMFLDFLSDLSGQTGQTRKVLLAAHGCSGFHRHILVRQLRECNLIESFQSLVLGTIDTMEVFKTKLKSSDQETKIQKDPYSLESLAAKYLDANFAVGQQRDAKVTVDMLKSLIEVTGCAEPLLKQHVKDLDVFMRSIHLKNVLYDAVSDKIREKIASAGITIDVLKDEYRENGGEGVSKLLLDKEVTKNKKVIQKLIEELARG